MTLRTRHAPLPVGLAPSITCRDIRLGHFLDRGTKRRDDRVWQPIDEADRIDISAHAGRARTFRTSGSR